MTHISGKNNWQNEEKKKLKKISITENIKLLIGQDEIQSSLSIPGELVPGLSLG